MIAKSLAELLARFINRHRGLNNGSGTQFSLKGKGGCGAGDIHDDAEGCAKSAATGK